MKTYLSELNDKQLEAVKTIAGPVMVFAGPGSGKTKTLTSRIIYMLDSKINSKSILAITFSNKAKDEMRLRLLKTIGDKTRDITILTFHALCAKILRKEIHHLAFKNDFNIIDETESSKILKNIVDANEYELDISLRSLSRKINSFKCYNRRSSYDIENEILDKYNEQLFQLNLLDYEDLLLKIYELFRKHPHVLEAYQKEYQYILIDEFQDTNDIQYQIVKMLSAEHKNLFVVGDINQSIYAFRGSNYENVLSFKKDFPNHKEIVLTKNYRSVEPILNKANNLIKFNNSNIEMQSDIKGSKYDVIYGEFDSESEQSKFIATEIRELKKQGIPLDDIAILYRSNLVLKKIELELIKNSIDYKIFGGIDFLKRKEIKDLIAYFRLIANPDDVFSFSRIVNIPNRKLGDSTIDMIVDIKSKTNLTLHEIIKQSITRLSKNKYDQLISFYEMIIRYNNKLISNDLVSILNELLSEIDYIGYLQKDDDYEQRLENIEEFKSILEYIETQKIIFTSEAINSVFDDILLSKDDSRKKPNGVVLSTIHSSKGLEFDYVFMIGLEEGIFPNSQKFDDPQEIMEERRICYVGMTRAKKKLYMTNTKKRLIYGKYQQLEKSRFIHESWGCYEEEQKNY